MPKPRLRTRTLSSRRATSVRSRRMKTATRKLPRGGWRATARQINAARRNVFKAQIYRIGQRKRS